MTDELHTHTTIGYVPGCPACEQVVMNSGPPVPPLNEDVANWQEAVADIAPLFGCFVCGEEDNHFGGYCPSGITREQAVWVRERRRAGIR